MYFFDPKGHALENPLINCTLKESLATILRKKKDGSGNVTADHKVEVEEEDQIFFCYYWDKLLESSERMLRMLARSPTSMKFC